MGGEEVFAPSNYITIIVKIERKAASDADGGGSDGGGVDVIYNAII